jgi:hypothetical protein
VDVSKDIFVAGGTAGTASLSSVQNTFSQQASPPRQVPMPGTVVLLGLGLIALGAGAWRRHRKHPLA